MFFITTTPAIAFALAGQLAAAQAQPFVIGAQTVVVSDDRSVPVSLSTDSMRIVLEECRRVDCQSILSTGGNDYVIRDERGRVLDTRSADLNRRELLRLELNLPLLSEVIDRGRPVRR